jgi:hypothetical protein
MRKIGAAIIASGAVLFGVAFTAHADNATCTENAKAAYKDCTAQCKSDYIDARFTCRNIDPACGTACLAGRQQCFDTVEQIKDTGQVPGGGTLDNCSGGTNACAAALQQAKTDCGVPCNGDTTCQDCVDQAQVTDFLCRDACGDSFRINGVVIAAKASCRSSFKACAQACPPAN